MLKNCSITYLAIFLGDCHYDVFTLDGTPAKQITWWGEIIASKQSNNKSDR
jgi:hypothetical protein